MKKQKGFTLIELLVVISIIGLLATIVLVSVNSVRAKARDIKRISDMRQIQIALAMYYDKVGSYPGNTDNDCGGWDVGNPGRGASDPFISSLINQGIMYKVPIDSTDQFDSSCSYRYYRYSGCSPFTYFYVLAVRLDKNQDNYGARDQIDTSCYAQVWWQSSYWYAIMEKE